MKGFGTAILTLIGAVILGGCGSLPFLSGGDNAEEAPPAEPVATEAAPAEPALTEEAANPEFEDPLVEEAAPVSSLRPATDPTQRLTEVAQPKAGREDPFGPNTIKVTVSIPPQPVIPQPLDPGSLPNLPGANGGPGANGEPLIPAIILPDPTIAKAVVVTGVVQVGSSPQAIVRAPAEPSSRYVSPGQRIANGQVLVKRIEVRGSEPVVILEESGIEVVKFVGDTAEQAPSTPGEQTQSNGLV